MPDREARCVYFEKGGPENTEATLALARERAQTLGLEHIVVASTSGQTGARAAELFGGRRVVVVTHSTGFGGPNEQELQPDYQARIEGSGARLLTCQHALGGLGRAVRRRLGTYQLEEIVAFVLRCFCQGMKVACEITVMATDAGLVPSGEEIIAIGGTGRGADTAVVIRAANGQDFFDLRIMEIICKPRLADRPQD
ncbi:MAG TPA: pyruvate kinase alpha/beta domain-containing protein [Anaerolineae bacterium]|nr:pyruvate kinase alpha/beta domain-containing protein [Anaerolineae bacterium]